MRDIIQFAKNSETEKVILFGSRARGTNMERSDVDLDAGISEDLEKELKKDGIVIYEKNR